ncbi:transposase [Streptomyces sp. Adlamb9]|uniref:transposase n=1 Tax=Streptomyces sp. Adlamb9 TaxID=3400629 RepID=UPI003F1BC38F
MTDAQRARIEQLLPDRMRDHRQVIDAIAFKYRPGTPWTDLPEYLGSRKWAANGIWEELFTSLLAQADTEGNLDWIAAADSPRSPGLISTPPGTLQKGPRPASPTTMPSDGPTADTTQARLAADSHCGSLAFVLTPGQAWNAPAFTEAMACSRVPAGGRPRTPPEAILADKAYSLRALRTHLRRRGIRAVIPQPSERIAKRKKRASPHPAEEYTRRPCLLARRMDGALARSQGAVEQACHTQRYRADLSSSAGSQFRRTTTRSLNCPVAWRR